MKYLVKVVFLCVSALASACYVQPGVNGYRVGTRSVADPAVYQAYGAPDAAVAYEGQPETVVLPGTNVYVVPDLATDLFFASGYWWRPYGGGWYRSPYYNRGWGYYAGVPAFYRSVPRNWRYNYAHRRWNGRPWNYQRTHVRNVEVGGPGGPNGRRGGARFEDQQSADQGGRRHQRGNEQFHAQPVGNGQSARGQHGQRSGENAQSRSTTKSHPNRKRK